MAKAYFRKETGTWYVLNKREKIKVGKSERAAWHLAQKINLEEAENKVGLYKTTEIGISDYFNEIQDYKKNVRGLRQQSITRYKAYIQNLLGFLEAKFPSVKKLSQLDQSVFEAYIRYRKTTPLNKNGRPISVQQMKKRNDRNLKLGAYDNTVKNEIQFFRSTLNYAVKNKDAGKRFLRQNPLEFIETVRVKEERVKRPLTKEEIERFLTYLAGKKTKELYEIFFMLLYTGMRIGELKHLEWSDVDFGKRTIVLKEKVITHPNGEIERWTPKTKNGKREIPIHDKVFEVLVNRKKNQKARSNFVFSNSNGGMLKRHLREELIRTMRKIGIKDFTRVHDLRRTFISFMAMAGVPRETTMDIVGHVDEETYELYRETTRQHRQESINKLDF